MKTNIQRTMNPQQNTYGAMPCYYLPKNLLSDKAFSGFSISSKMLTGILLSCAENSQTIVETAELINMLGKEQIKRMLNELNSEKGNQDAI